MHVRELDIKIDVLWFPGGLVKERRPADEQYRTIPTLSQIPASFHLPLPDVYKFLHNSQGNPLEFYPTYRLTIFPITQKMLVRLEF